MTASRYCSHRTAQRLTMESIGENLNVMTLGDGTVIYFDNFGNIVNP